MILNNREDIIRLLEKIIEKSAILNKYRDQIPQIEIDLILSDIRDLYQTYSHINNQIPESEEIINASKRKESEVLREDVKKIPIEPLKVLKEEETINAETPKEMEEPQIAKEIKTEIPITNLAFNTNQIIAEKFKDDTNSINDRMALNKTDNSVASKINEHHLNDIKKGIGINEKFLFIKELYHGNIEEYDESINKLNTFHSLPEAFDFFSSQINKYNWDEKSEAYLTLKKLIERKFV